MKVYDTHKLEPDDLTKWERELVYNGLDACVTAEVLDVLLPQLDNISASTYAFSKALQGPVLEMRLRGVLVDQARKSDVIEEYHQKLDILERSLERIVGEGCGQWEFNWRSNAHLKELFYDRLGIPVIKLQGRPTVNRDALERMESYYIAVPIVAHLKALRDIGKKISVLKTEIDPDGRIRTSYNIAGTTTGRFSSSFSEFGTGGNLQNVEDALRSIFIADPGYKMAYFDAEQGESRCVGAILWNLFRDGRYLDACEGGDLHTSVAKLVWPRLGWTGKPKLDKELAEQPYYRHYSRRFMCKKIGHGSNYGGKPRTLAAQAKVDIELIQEFQPPYFANFGMPNWHSWVKEQLYAVGYIINLTGRRRYFMGRRDSDDTLREAIAYDPQGSLADIVNNGMLRVWLEHDCILLMQNHDAIIVEYPQEREDEVIPKIYKQLRYPVPLQGDRELVIPYGCKTGWNFGEYCCGDRTRKGCEECRRQVNPDGLKSYVPGDKRRRSPEVPILDRIFR